MNKLALLITLTLLTTLTTSSTSEKIKLPADDLENMLENMKPANSIRKEDLIPEIKIDLKDKVQIDLDDNEALKKAQKLLNGSTTKNESIADGLKIGFVTFGAFFTFFML